MESFGREDSGFLRETAGAVSLFVLEWGGKKKKTRALRSGLMSAFDALGEFRSLRRAIIFCFWLKPGADTGFQEGISPSADGDQATRLEAPGDSSLDPDCRLRAGFMRCSLRTDR